MDKNDVKVSAVIGLYLLYQEDKNHSPKTVRWYKDMLRRFADALGPEARVSDITTEAVRQYLRSVFARGFTKFTNHGYARTIKTFLRWLGREGYVAENFYRVVDMPKVPKWEDVTIDVLSAEEITHLLGMFNTDTDVGSRDRAIVCLMLESGLRLAEVANLRFDDVHLKELYIKVRGKGDKEAFVPIGPTSQKALARYMTAFHVPANVTVKALFLNIYGEPLKYETIKTIFDRLAVRSGIKRLHPHLLRHTAATRMLAMGADVHSVQRQLRHSDIRTTLRYLHLAHEQLQEKMQLFSPLTGIGEGRRRMVPTGTRK